MTVPDDRPLYARIEAQLLRRLTEDWTPGTLLPTEFELADQLGVSQGTVRRALGLLERRRLVERRPGRGTVVARQTSERSLYHFFRVAQVTGERVVPTSSLVVAHTQGKASKSEQIALDITQKDEVHRIKRIRMIQTQVIIFETIILPKLIFPDFTILVGSKLEEEFYVLYQQRYTVTVTRATERLSAIAADEEVSRYLGISVGAPLQKIDRVAIDLNEKKVEWRRTLLDCRDYVYVAEIR